MKEWGVTDHNLEPWKAYVLGMADRLDHGVLHLRENLQILIESLQQAGAGRTVNMYVRPVLRLVNTFGLHLARLDVRQNSDAYDKALSQMMLAGGLRMGRHFRNGPSIKNWSFLMQSSVIQDP